MPNYGYHEIPEDAVNEMNTTEYQDNNYPVIPPGEYNVIVESAEIKSNKSMDGQVAWIGLQVSGGQYAGSKLLAFLNIINKNEVAQNIGRKNLKNLFISAGFSTVPKNIQVLLGKKSRVKVKVGTGENGDPQNSVDSFLVDTAANGRIKENSDFLVVSPKGNLKSAQLDDIAILLGDQDGPPF